MGAWGPGNFENDDALDFVGGLAVANDAKPLQQVFEPVISSAMEGEEIDASTASLVLAAAELIAAAKGRPSKDFPVEANDYLERIVPPSPELVGQASEAVSSVLLSSELLELWEESDEPEAWNRTVTDLIERLAAPTAPLKARKPPADRTTSFICSFCAEQILESALVRLSASRPETAGTMERNIFAHVDCLNAKLHPRHILQWWRIE